MDGVLRNRSTTDHTSYCLGPMEQVQMAINSRSEILQYQSMRDETRSRSCCVCTSAQRNKSRCSAMAERWIAPIAYFMISSLLQRWRSSAIQQSLSCLLMKSSGLRFMRGHRRETRMFADLALIYNADFFFRICRKYPMRRHEVVHSTLSICKRTQSRKVAKLMD